MKQRKATALRGLVLRQMIPEDVEAMLALQARVLAALPDPSWYVPSDRQEFTEALEARDAFGYYDGGVLAGFAEITPASARGERGYALKLNEPTRDTFDFHDVMVGPDYRGRGIHTAFLSLFSEMVRGLDGRAIYATVDPGNAPSYRNFERAGYALVVIKPAYDGRLRRFYRLTLPAKEETL
ncbi:MAG: GNAT family N-acetyltransferase [Clostridia bacterium]